MEGLPTSRQMQMDFIEQKELLWCERTQDMSGYIPSDITLPLSDEQIQFEFSTAQYGHDIEVQNLENPSSEKFIMGDSFEAALSENSNMFDNTNYSLLDTKITAWLPKVPDLEINGLDKTSTIEDNGNFRIHDNSEDPPIFSLTPKVEKKLLATVIKKPSSLSIFDCEEPLIKEDLESLSSCCTDNKLAFELRYDMEVAEEVVVTTEYSDELESKESPFLFNSASLQSLDESKLEYYNAQILPSPLRDCVMETSQSIKFDMDEDFLYTFDPVTSPVVESKVAPKLHLNIAAAMATSNQLLLGDLADTPDVLKPVLNPGLGFDLVDYLLANNCDSNNNTSTTTPSSLPSRTCTQRTEQGKGKSQLSLTTPPSLPSRTCTQRTEQGKGKSQLSLTMPPSLPSRTCTQRTEQRKGKSQLSLTIPPSLPSRTCIQRTEQRKGKSQLSLTELKESQNRNSNVQTGSMPGTSTGSSSSQRSIRTSATKFKKKIQAGLLNMKDADDSSLDEYDSVAKFKRRRTTTSSCNRKRLNSDSDCSSVCESAVKYRERRDRNNVSSKMSRQKRKIRQELKQLELKELEEENKRLKRSSEELQSALHRVHTAWKEYLKKINKGK